jgi:hypothetical protein
MYSCSLVVRDHHMAACLVVCAAVGLPSMGSKGAALLCDLGVYSGPLYLTWNLQDSLIVDSGLPMKSSQTLPPFGSGMKPGHATPLLSIC